MPVNWLSAPNLPPPEKLLNFPLAMIEMLNMFVNMNTEESEFPQPEVLEEAADEMPRKVPLQSYKHAMLKLREKGYSYQEVAVWISKQLDVPVTRNQVAYVVNMEPDPEQEEAEVEREAEDAARA